MASAAFRILTLIDHRIHKAHESLYPLLTEMRKHPACHSIEIASRANPQNDDFFLRHSATRLAAMRVEDPFIFDADGSRFMEGCREVDLRDYDLVFLRLAKPNPPPLFKFLESSLEPGRIINRPSGILEAGSKAFLLNFPDISPALKLCHSVEDVLELREQRPIVLKPLFEAGGRGIVRIEGNSVWKGMEKTLLDPFLPEMEANLNREPYLAMEFLRHNEEGDKRIIVVNGKIVAAALRLPAPGSWICNVNMGGRSVPAEPDEAELEIAGRIIPVLESLGIVLFGFDTLMGNHGKRVLSEINASNAGGMLPAEQDSGKPVIRPAATLLWDYILKNIKPLKHAS